MRSLTAFVSSSAAAITGSPRCPARGGTTREALGDAVGWILLASVAAVARAAFDPLATATMAGLTVAFFAVFHGHSHGTEMPETMSGLAYGAGFVAATAAREYDVR